MVVNEFTELRKLEEQVFDDTTPETLAELKKETEQEIGEHIKSDNTRFEQILNCLPIINNNSSLDGLLQPQFWRYYKQPWGSNFFYDMHDPYNDLVMIIWGPRGGGKSITAVTLSIVDGMMRGIPVISNVPISWVAKDADNKLYKVESIHFDVEKFSHGDSSFKYKRLLIDEGNYLADRLRSTSNKNLAMTDILQQARKFRMCVTFCTINWMWIDPRVTGSLCDVLIECNDLYYNHGFRRKHHLRKGERITWDIEDQSGKLSGKQFTHLMSTTFNARGMWGTYNTENFVDPRDARKKLQGEDKMITDDNGNEVKKSEWLEMLKHKLVDLVHSGLTQWKSNDLWTALMIQNDGLRKIAGRYMKYELGVEKSQSGFGGTAYDLSAIEG